MYQEIKSQQAVQEIQVEREQVFQMVPMDYQELEGLLLLFVKGVYLGLAAS